jgi:imidazole glycerol-phosphate synthase
LPCAWNVGVTWLPLQVLNSRGFTQPLKEYIQADRPFFGICLGMQTLFEGSEECPGVAVSGSWLDTCGESGLWLA